MRQPCFSHISSWGPRTLAACSSVSTGRLAKATRISTPEATNAVSCDTVLRHAALCNTALIKR